MEPTQEELDQLAHFETQTEKWYKLFLEVPSPSNWTLLRHNALQYQYWFNLVHEREWKL